MRCPAVVRCEDVPTVADRVSVSPPRLGPVRLLALDGPSGSGKTTVAGLLHDELHARGLATVVVPTDHFATWHRPVSWWPRLAEGVLEPLSRAVAGGYRPLDWSSGAPRYGHRVTVPVVDVLVVEGVSAGRAALRPRLSRLCWVAGPGPAQRLERSVARDGSAERGHLRAWQRFERNWFVADRTAENADSCIRND